MTLHINCFMGEENVLMSTSKKIITIDDTVDLAVYVRDNEGNPIEGVTVTFYQDFTPEIVLTANKPIIMSGDKATLEVKVTDSSDGSLIVGETVTFYKED